MGNTLTMMKLVLLSVACLVGVQSSSQLAKKIHRDITKFNNDAACWGKGNAIKFRVALINAAEQCSSSPSHNLLKPVNPFLAVLTPHNNPFQTLPAPAPASNPLQTLPASTSQVLRLPQQGFNIQNWSNLWSTVYQPSSRGKRDTATSGLLETDEEDFQEFLEDFADYKADMTTKMSNLTCVLSKLEMIDHNLQVNLKVYTHDFWNEIDLSQTLARNPITKVYGRHMIFFKCAKKAEAKSCMLAQADDWLKTMYGEDPSFNYPQYGLPANKYERAILAVKVLTEAASDEEEFVG